jgi:hypothetical protein
VGRRREPDGITIAAQLIGLLIVLGLLLGFQFFKGLGVVFLVLVGAVIALTVVAALIWILTKNFNTTTPLNFDATVPPRYKITTKAG